MGDLELLENRLTGGGSFYHWQRRLLREWLLQGRVPNALDVPTGLGKTKVMTAWLIARAVGSALPRRLVYVVDRRAVVDQATTEAEALASLLCALLRDESIDSTMRENWRKNLGLDAAGKMAISTLRGKFLDNRKWMDQPHAASIVVGTVDMVGSRLLFSGYGVRPRMRAVHAGLLGCDSLLVLDEAHLVPPFESLLHQIVRLTERDRSLSGRSVPVFSIMALSATGRTPIGNSTFQLNEEDLIDPPVHARMSATKRLRVHPRVEPSKLAEALADHAWSLSEDTRRVVVFCNSRKVAQAVESILRTRVKGRFGSAKLTELFVGERRVRERTLMYDPPKDTDLFSLVLPRFAPDAKPGSVPAFLIATAAAEVGVDLDADDLVCDLVPWERMVQRFGRVNRRPNPGSARIAIVPSASEKDEVADSDALSLADLIAPFEATEWPHGVDGTVDASPLSLQVMKARIPTIFAAATTRPPYHPSLSQAVVEAWAMTTLREHSGRPLVQPWLRGWDENPQAQCSVAWRRHFPIRPSFRGALADVEALSDLQAFFEAAPLHATELLEAPVGRVTDILKARAKAWSSDPSESGSEQSGHAPFVIVIDEKSSVEAVFSVKRLREAKPEDIERVIAQRMLVVDARLGGLDDSGLLDAKAALRPPTLDGDVEAWALPLETYGGRRVRFGIVAPPADDWRLQGFRWREKLEDDDDDYSQELWVEVWRGRDATAGNPAISSRPQGLAEHHDWTREAAELIAVGIGLSPEHTALLCTAAAIHDAGKNRDVWQNAMNASPYGRPFAKTTGGAKPTMLAGYRHEFGSLSDAANVPHIDNLPDEDRELALHLVAAHHGRSRPSIDAIDPSQAPSHSRALAQESALRYVRLQKRWGAWGLAWWETLLRAADWAASRRLNADE